MQTGGKRGRKPRILSTAEKLLIAEFCTQLFFRLAEPGESIESVAIKLRVCKASLYNYLNERTLPGYDVLKKAHDVLGFHFQYLDFTSPRGNGKRSEKVLASQGVLPFLEMLRSEDLKVIAKKTVESENALQVTIQIKFVG